MLYMNEINFVLYMFRNILFKRSAVIINSYLFFDV